MKESLVNMNKYILGARLKPCFRTGTHALAWAVRWRSYKGKVKTLLPLTEPML